MTWADDKMLALDFEATSIDPLTTRPVSFGLVYMDFGQVTKTRYGLIDPEIPIPPESTEIHGITDSDVQARGGNLTNTVIGIAGELLLADSSDVPLVVYNAPYDVTLLDACLKRLEGSEGLVEMGWTGTVIDPLVIDRKVDKWRKGGRTLTALCEHYGVELGDAHNAAADATATLHVARAIAEKYRFIGKTEPYLLHHQQHQWRKEWATEFSEYRVKKGQEPLGEDEGDWPMIGCKDVAPETAAE